QLPPLPGSTLFPYTTLFRSLSCWTPLPMMAIAVVNMLRSPDAILNRGIYVSGVLDLTQNAILAALEAETGDKFAVENVDLQQIKDRKSTRLNSSHLGISYAV